MRPHETSASGSGHSRTQKSHQCSSASWRITSSLALSSAVDEPAPDAPTILAALRCVVPFRCDRRLHICPRQQQRSPVAGPRPDVAKHRCRGNLSFASQWRPRCAGRRFGKRATTLCRYLTGEGQALKSSEVSSRRATAHVGKNEIGDRVDALFCVQWSLCIVARSGSTCSFGFLPLRPAGIFSRTFFS